jgi:integrase
MPNGRVLCGIVFHTCFIRTMASSFAKVVDRTKLKPRRDPYWQKVRKGCFIGFRKMTSSSEGNWLARVRDELTEKQVQQPLGDFSELPASERYDRALKSADEWFTHLHRGGSKETATLRTACERYVQHLRETSTMDASKDAEKRFERWVYTDAKLSATELPKLRGEQIESWRRKLKAQPLKNGTEPGKARSDSSLNRDMTPFRAALNKALADGLATSDHPWRTKLTPIKNADNRRDIYLDREQRRKLIAHADADFADFLRGMSLLPLRPGALALLTVGHFDKRLDTLTIGQDKQGKDRKIKLPKACAALMRRMSVNKLPTAPLFSRANGSMWNKDAWKHPMKRAAASAGLTGDAVVYAMRHSAITDLVHTGLDTLTVAQLSGTSVVMIEKHYGHLRQEHAQKALATLTL